MVAARRPDDIRVLGEIKRDNKKKLDKQRAAYMSLLDYFIERAKLDNKKYKDYRVTDVERRIFDAVKIITEANWVINSPEEFKTILNQIGVEWPIYHQENESPNRFSQVNQVTKLVQKLYELLGFEK